MQMTYQTQLHRFGYPHPIAPTSSSSTVSRSSSHLLKRVACHCGVGLAFIYAGFDRLEIEYRRVLGQKRVFVSHFAYDYVFD